MNLLGYAGVHAGLSDVLINEWGNIMGLGFMASAKRGQHYELSKSAVRKLKKIDILLKGKDEKKFEHSIVANLQSVGKLKNNLITQISEDEVDKISQANLFGFNHRPDLSIGRDGTAIEIKVVSGGPAIRDLIGQAIVYRMQYRFVILVIIDKTGDSRIVKSCLDKKSSEYALLQGLSKSWNIFSVIGPTKKGVNNVVFVD